MPAAVTCLNVLSCVLWKCSQPFKCTLLTCCFYTADINQPFTVGTSWTGLLQLVSFQEFNKKTKPFLYFETLFYTHSKVRKLYKFVEKNHVPSVKYSRGCVMMWAGFAAKKHAKHLFGRNARIKKKLNITTLTKTFLL